MYKGTIVENSLIDKNILEKVQITKTWQDEDWILYDVLVEENQLYELGKSLADGPWYMNFWIPEGDEMKVVYKDKIFDLKISDKSTWDDALVYGRSIGIPEEQLDFVSD
ncbi:MAG: hypothetical protein WAX80_03545 [Minisyncoccia bacterium]